MVKVKMYHFTKSGNKSKAIDASYLTLEEAKKDIHKCINNLEQQCTRSMGWCDVDVKEYGLDNLIQVKFSPVIAFYKPLVYNFEIIQ